MEKVCADVLGVAPANYTALSRLAFARYSRGACKAAERAYRHVLALHPSDTVMMIGLGWTYTKQGRPDDAAAQFQRAIEIQGTDLRAQAGFEACCR